MAVQEDFVRASKLEPEQVNRLLRAFRQPAPIPGWHNSNDIQTMIGLEGRHMWFEQLPRMFVMNFKFAANGNHDSGTYTLDEAEVNVEQGNFFCTPNNNRIGFGAITLVPKGANKPRMFVVLNMIRNQDRIDVMILERVNAEALPALPLFCAVRTR